MEEWLKEIENCKKLEINTIKKEINTKPVAVRKDTTLPASRVLVDCDYSIVKNDTLGIDRKLDKKLKGGQIKIDKTIDFHGKTLDEAFDSLLLNIESAFENGLRMLLVITGKGRGTKEGKESIKSQIEYWMKHPNISSKVIKYTDAQQRDGGTGALYVLLKRKK